MEGLEVSRLGELALAWLLTRAEGKGGRGDLARALKPFADHRWSGVEWSTRLDEALAGLEAQDQVRQTARKGLSLTPEGRARGLAVLGVQRLPKGTTWKQLKRTHLMALALKLPPSADHLARLGKADGTRAVLVQKLLGLEAPGSRSLAQVRDALCWKQLGVETDRPFTLAAVQAVLLGRLAQASREVSAAQALQQLAARSVGARRMDPENLRLAAMRSWLFSSEETASSLPAARTESAPAPSSKAASRQPPPREEDLSAFAQRVLAVARTSSTGRFGGDRVFISHIWRALRGPGLDEQSFKNRLVEANQRRLLSLSRADMVHLMDPADVAASEVRHLGASFHFIAL